MSLQWQGLLQNLGQWQGSFTQFSPSGECLSDVPSLLTLALSPTDEQTLDFSLQRFPVDASPHTLNFTYRYPGPAPQQVPFMASGAFSQGSVQWSPVSECGAELAFIFGDRRLRLVQRYPTGKTLSSITLIREHRVASNAIESPALTLDAVLGTWEGEAVTQFADARVGEPYLTHLEVQQSGQQLQQRLSFANQVVESTGRIEASQVRFTSGPQPMQLLCLPGGASSLCPLEIQSATPFLLEAGWLIAPDLRQRLIRSYNEKGEWVSLTLVTERKVA